MRASGTFGGNRLSDRISRLTNVEISKSSLFTSRVVLCEVYWAFNRTEEVKDNELTICRTCCRVLVYDVD